MEKLALFFLGLFMAFPASGAQLAPLKSIYELDVPAPSRLTVCLSRLWVYSRQDNAFYLYTEDDGRKIIEFKPHWLTKTSRVTALSCASSRLLVSLKEPGRSRLFTTEILAGGILKIDREFIIPLKERVDSLSCGRFCFVLLSGRPHQLSLKTGNLTPVNVPPSNLVLELGADLKKNPFANWQDKLDLAKARYTDVEAIATGPAYLDGMRNTVVFQTDQNEYRKFGDWGAWEGHLMGPRSFLHFDTGEWVIADTFLKALFFFSKEAEYLGMGALDGKRLPLLYPVDMARSGERFWVADFQRSKVFAYERTLTKIHIHAKPETFVRTNLFRESDFPVRGLRCLSCHDGTLRDDLDKFAPDRPGHRGECVFCHDPHHGGESPFLKETNSRKMCTKCHKVQKVISKNHPMGKKVQCVSCHLVHGEKNKHLRMDKATNLCLKCHKERKPQHRNIDLILETERAQGLRFEDGQIYCLTCHKPHATHEKSQLRHSVPGVKNFCASCHGKKTERLYNDFHKEMEKVKRKK